MHFLDEPSVIWVATNITVRKKLENLLFEQAHTDTKINDSLGHPGREAALRVVADVLRSHCRTSDFCARLGGDEFVVLCPHISMEDAYLFSERIRQSCFEALEPYSAPDHRAALSIGVTCFSEQDTSPDASVLRADRGIYRSKSLGGNQTCMVPAPI